MNKKIGILGYGQIGKAIASFYNPAHVYKHDPAKQYEFPLELQLDILHVCIPFDHRVEFEASVKFAIDHHARGALVFVHSTVAVGTTAEIAKYHNFVVHAPVRGVHPNLTDGIKTFPMYVGADSPGAGRIAAEHLELLGIQPIVIYKSASTELLKLLDTTYYGVSIAYHAYAKALCDATGVNFDIVVRDANRTYNEGYTTLGKENVVRPVLFAPEDGKIGGHCVIPNAEILKAQFGEDPLLETILRHK